MSDLTKILRDYQRWMKDETDQYGQPAPSITLDDIDGDETFGAAATEIERLEAKIKQLNEKNSS